MEQGTRIVSVSDPDDEVRTVVRMVVDALRDGVELDRMAILFGANEPYARLVDEQLSAAGIPHNGAAVRTLAESVLGRALLALLALPDRDFHRQDVMALLASAPIRADGRLVPAARWERISRQIGIVRGGARWDEQLERHARGLERQLAEELTVPDRDPRPGWFEHEVDATRRLQAFMRSLQRDLARGATAGATWQELVAWAQALVHDYVANGEQRGAWPEAEQQAADKVDAALERLAGLDAVEGPPGLDVFRRTLALQLDDDLGRVGRLGDGILMGHVGLGLGLDLDRVFLCGMAEGTFPARVRDDSLLPDTDRRAHERCAPVALGAGRCRSRPVPRRDRGRAATSACCCSRAATFAVPPSACRRASCSTPWKPSSAPVSTPTISSTSPPTGSPWSRRSRRVSHASTSRRPIRSTASARCSSTGAPAVVCTRTTLVDHDDALASGLTCTLAHASAAFTRFDGNLSQLAITSPASDDVIVSPTRLESWARSPHDYLMQQVLRVEIPELPEESYELSPLDRGSLVHTVLDEFLREVLARPTGAPAPGRAVDTGRPHPNARDRRGAVRAVRGRRSHGAPRLLAPRQATDPRRPRPLPARATTKSVPSTGSPPLPRSCGSDSAPTAAPRSSSGSPTDGCSGSAARPTASTEAADGMLWVFDYKTGKPSGIDPVDPTSAGTRLQLPVYAARPRGLRA